MNRKTFLFITMGLGAVLIAFFVIKTFVNAQDEKLIQAAVCETCIGEIG